MPHAPRAATRAWIARALFLRAVRGLPLRVVLPDGAAAGGGGPEAPVMTIERDAFFHRLAAGGKIGFGEAYMAGDWRADDLSAVLGAFASRVERLLPGPLQRLRGLYEPRIPAEERNTVTGSARNVARHYDLSNDLFALFLDPTMTYSAAVFEPGDTLEGAQIRKYDALCRMIGLGPSDHVLEIGTGWGGFAIHAASTYRCRVTTATISQAQAALARARVAAAGLSDRVEVVLRDYRALEGRYSNIVSIEMLEAVGEEYWPVFFAACDRLLEPDGAIGLQTITMPHRRYLASRHAYSWIHKYIFPGGLIPSREAIDRTLRDASSLRVTDAAEIGRHYGTTLRHWRDRFLAERERVQALGFDATFVRMWEFYLAYCEAGFATGALGNAQLRLARA
ncbi:MAG TPA: cyclopropane-fatty-acyl-phospholipid synthase family protein [Gaiellales bacterium]|nr:cyclopropane-fatty-acyl-phospholipid synthase family protein [Gaiellales bacterium]